MQAESYSDTWLSFREGNWDAYTRLYNAFYGPLNNYGVKFTRDITLVEDSVHDLYVKLWTSRNRLGNPASVKNYLYKSFRNILFRKINNTKRYDTLSITSDNDGFHVNFPSQAHEPHHKEIREQLNIFIKQLSPRQQEIIFLRFYEDFSYEEISEIMSIDVNSAYKLLYKALDSLQKTLGPGSLFLLLIR